MDLNRINTTFECHNKTAPSVVASISNAASSSNLPMRISVKRVPIGRDLNSCRIMVTGDAFNFAGVKMIRDAIKQARSLS